MSPTKKSTKKKPTAKKATPAKKAPAKKASARREPAASARRAPAPKALAKKAAAAAGEKKQLKSKPAASRRAVKAPAPEPEDNAPRGGLGTKYRCFKCSAKFYDLNRPRPLCPKCGADQREAPKQTAKMRNVPPPKDVEVEIEREVVERDRERERAARRMGPLLDEDDEEIVIEDEADDIDLALDAVEDEEFLESDEEEPEVEEG